MLDHPDSRLEVEKPKIAWSPEEKQHELAFDKSKLIKNGKPLPNGSKPRRKDHPQELNHSLAQSFPPRMPLSSSHATPPSFPHAPGGNPNTLPPRNDAPKPISRTKEKLLFACGWLSMCLLFALAIMPIAVNLAWLIGICALAVITITTTLLACRESQKNHAAAFALASSSARVIERTGGSKGYTSEKKPDKEAEKIKAVEVKMDLPKLSKGPKHKLDEEERPSENRQFKVK